MSFTNLYYKRTAGTAKACYVCYKPTTTVLTTINMADFLYTCPGHLSDQGFASLVSTNEVSKAAVSAEEIAKVKAEWEEKEKKRVEREKEKAKEKDKEKDKAKEKEKDKDKDSNNKAVDKEKKTEESKSPKIPATTSTSPPPTHERYTLHRDFFSMRQNEHRRRRQATQAKELAPRLPVVPRGEVEKY